MESNQNNNIEELLNDLKSQHNLSNASETSPQSDEVENLLDNVKSKLKSDLGRAEARCDRTSVEKNEVTRDDSPVDNYLESLKAQYQKNHQPQTPLKNNRASAAKKNNMTQDDSPVDNYLDSIKAQYQNQQNEQPTELDNIKSELKSDLGRAEARCDRTPTANNSSVDDYLESLKTQYQPKKQQPQTPLKNERASTANNSQADNYLDSFKAQYQNKQHARQPELNNIKSELKNNKASTANSSQADNYLDSFKAQYQNKQTQQKAREKSNYSQNKQEIIVREQQKQLKRKQLTRQAEKWLAKLDPLSSEGMWFNQLAESYPSRLEAAISYLSTIEQSNP